jgi:hypothetical protein
MAIYGVKGKVITPDHTLLNFQLRYSFDFGPQQGYRVHAVLERQAGDPVEEINLATDEPLTDEGQSIFENRVRGLTEQYVSSGLSETMRSFLTPKRGHE